MSLVAHDRFYHSHLKLELNRAFPQAIDLDKFLATYFSEIYQDLGDGMERAARLEALLQTEMEKPGVVWTALVSDLIRNRTRRPGLLARIFLKVTGWWRKRRNGQQAKQLPRSVAERLEQDFPNGDALRSFCKDFLPDLYREIGTDMQSSRIQVLILTNVDHGELQHHLDAVAAKRVALGGVKVAAVGVGAEVAREGIQKIEENDLRVKEAGDRLGRTLLGRRPASGPASSPDASAPAGARTALAN